jgi:methylenetetrahydrofolate reductase (NADPH)
LEQLLKFASSCGASVPAFIQATLQNLDASTTALISFQILFDQVENLMNNGFHTIHFYALNHYASVLGVYQLLKGKATI